jgi:hypothetical protein
MKQTGSRAQVMAGTAKHTSGGLTKGDLKVSRDGKIVSRRKSELAKRNNPLGPYLMAKSRTRPVCHRGKSIHCGDTCIPVGAKCHM